MSRAAVFDGPGRVRIAEQTAELTSPRDAVLAIEACGICGSDVTSFHTGAYVSAGQVMGHEFLGRVVSAGPEAAVRVGDRLAVRPMRSCGSCWYCCRGDIHLCSATARLSMSFGLPGGYADHVLVPEPEPGVNVFPLPEDVDALDALWVEPLAVALRAIERAGQVVGRRVLIIGAGSLGLCLLTAARLAGATTYVLEPRETRRRLAADLGAERTAADVDALGIEQVDVVLDTSGVPVALGPVIGLTDPGTPIVLVGVTHADLDVPAGLAVRGSFGYREADFTAAAAPVASGRVALHVAVTHEFDLQDFVEAMEVAATDPEAGKVVIRP